VMQERRNLPRGPAMAQPFFGSPMPGPGGMMHPGIAGAGGGMHHGTSMGGVMGGVPGNGFSDTL
jgi:hypothetical protein